MKNCVKWLGELAGGTTWVDEMKQLQEAAPEELAEEPLTGTILF